MPDMKTLTVNGTTYDIVDETARNTIENLSASDVGARPDTWTPTASDVGAPTLDYAKKVGAPRNLLDNSDFKNRVNQRGSSTYMLGTWGGYTIDRWFACEKGATLTLYEDSIGLNGGGDIAQIIPNPQKLSGKKLTFAAKIYGRIFCCSGTVNYSNSWARVASYSVANDVTIEILTQSNNELWVYIVNNGANETYLEWAALYEGEYTAETLPEYQPKGYAAELMECRRYFYKLRLAVKNGLLTSSKTNLRFGIPLPVIMRIENPTVTELNISGLRTTTGSNMTPTITEFTAQIYKDGWLDLLAKIEAISDATNNTPVAAYVGADISADL